MNKLIELAALTGALRRIRAMSGLMLLGLGAGHANEAPESPAEIKPVIRLISAEQYSNSIAYIFGPDIKAPASLPPLRRVDGLDAVGAGSALVAPATLSIFNTSAKAISAQVMDPSRRGTLMACKPMDQHRADDKCSAAFFKRVGRLLFRRPLSSAELQTYVSSASRAANELSDFYAGVRFGLAGMMVAPQFIYFVETTEPDPQHAGSTRLDAYSKASRLSLMLWNSTPDEELLRSAERGDLHTREGLDRQVTRMLASERLAHGVRAFFSDMLFLESFADMVKDPVIYPAFTTKVASDSQEQILRILEDHLLTRQGDYRDIFTTRNIFLSQPLASIYRVPVAVPGLLEWAPYELPESDPRAGILTQIGFLAVNSHPGRSSATRRGRALREGFMCQTVPEPPPNVDFSAIETPDPNIRTARERLSVHNTNPVCAGCHKITDPIGLSLENFDGAGQFRVQEKGADIDVAGALSGKKFNSAKQMGATVREEPAITACVVKRLYQYGVGRRLTPDEKPILKGFEGQFASEGYRFVPLLHNIVTSDSFFATEVAPAAAPNTPLTAASIEVHH